ncbi:hypothetical protein C1J00_36180 [Streptomyces cahuitamycinicus]|uniref:YD repeat-containing protein n=1 Tax=Streptomyces cahuitamycinicus TaxID=2070367 RepID=A0A2N8TEQ4_9ACTN|nr:hypothetical protein C1J00_36180 [Streptomyces cahuitamycinicus]
MQGLAPEDALSPKPDTRRYECEAEDRLIGMTTPDGTCWCYRYGPLGAARGDFAWRKTVKRLTALPSRSASKVRRTLPSASDGVGGAQTSGRQEVVHGGQSVQEGSERVGGLSRGGCRPPAGRCCTRRCE